MSGAVSVAIGAVVVAIVTLLGTISYLAAGTDHPDNFGDHDTFSEEL